MRKNWILPAAVLLCTAGILAADLMTPDRFFSALENRKLAQKPEISVSSLLDGSFMKSYEDYVADQFPGRNAFITVKTGILRLMGKKDINGVYFAADNTLMERHAPESVDMERAAQKRERMLKQAAEIRELIPGRTALMLVPSADAVQAKRLPAYAESFDQASWIGETAACAEAAGITAVDVMGALLDHSAEKIYYGTDHHWTTLGAFYGYQAMAKAYGLQKPELSEFERTVVKTDFFGTLQAKVNLPVAPDEMEIFERQGEKKHPTTFVYEEKEADSCYFYERLQTRDAYAFFMDGNYPVVRMQGDGPAEKTILLIKDSYANCFVPFLSRDYGMIWLVDPRYYRDDLTELVREYEPVDVMYLFNVFQFMENF